MNIIYVLGALLWSVVLLAVLRRVTEQRKAQQAHQARVAEQQRLWQADIDEATELYRQLRHAQCMARLDEVAALAAAGK